MLVQRWGMLRTAKPCNLSIQKIIAIINALAKLHNFCVNESNLPEDILESLDNATNYIMNHPQGYVDCFGITNMVAFLYQLINWMEAIILMEFLIMWLREVIRIMLTQHWRGLLSMISLQPDIGKDRGEQDDKIFNICMDNYILSGSVNINDEYSYFYAVFPSSYPIAKWSVNIN